MIGLIVVVAVLVVGAAIGATVTEVARRVRPARPGVHVPRDEFARDPLAAPLRAGCESLEIAVSLDGEGRLCVVRATGFQGPAAAIGPLVLARLARLAADNGGHVRAGDTVPLTLYVEIMEAGREQQIRAYEQLDAQLRRYADLFSRLRDGRVTLGAITVALVGASVPRAHVAAQSDRLAFCDGSFADVGPWGAPVLLVPTVSEHWSWRFGWDGTGRIPPEERAALRAYVAAAHADGRSVRVYGLPDGPCRVRRAFWAELAGAGVDVISTGKPRALARFLEAERHRSRPAHALVEHPGPLPIWRPRPPRTAVTPARAPAGAIPGGPAVAPAIAPAVAPAVARTAAPAAARAAAPRSQPGRAAGREPGYTAGRRPAPVRVRGQSGRPHGSSIPERTLERVYGRASAHTPAPTPAPAHVTAQATAHVPAHVPAHVATHAAARAAVPAYGRAYGRAPVRPPLGPATSLH